MNQKNNLPDWKNLVETPLMMAVEYEQKSAQELVFATRNHHDLIEQRIVILRAYDTENHTIRFYSDHRAHKIRDIKYDQRVGVLFYHHDTRVQLRFQGIATVHHDDSVAEKAWRNLKDNSKVFYKNVPAPGSPLEGPEAYDRPLDPDQAYNNFCVVQVRIEGAQFRKLGKSGTGARARFKISGQDISGQWIAP